MRDLRRPPAHLSSHGCLRAAGVEQGGDGFAVGLTLAELHHCSDECAHGLALTRTEF